MDELDKALGDILSIRQQVARTTVFRGYGPATLATTGAFALVAAGAQAVWIAQPAQHVLRYALLWCSTAMLSIAFAGIQMYTRSRRMHSGMSDEMIHTAVEQFLPAIGAGILLTVVLLRAAPALAWQLPGLWQIIFSLGIFASCRFLPRPIVASGVWYLLCGILCMGLGGYRALSPWAMAVPFGAGQLLIAAILYFCERESGNESQINTQ